MRPSFFLVRSSVASTDRPSESTLSFTSPTLVRTNFFVAHAVVPPTVNAATDTTANSLFIMMRLLCVLSAGRRRPQHSCDVAAPGSNDQRLISCAHHERVPAGRRARAKCNQVLGPELVADLARRRSSLHRRP